MSTASCYRASYPGLASPDKRALLPLGLLCLNFELVALLDGDERVHLLVVVLQHLPEGAVVTHVLRHVLL